MALFVPLWYYSIFCLLIFFKKEGFSCGTELFFSITLEQKLGNLGIAKFCQSHWKKKKEISKKHKTKIQLLDQCTQRSHDFLLKAQQMLAACTSHTLKVWPIVTSSTQRNRLSWNWKHAISLPTFSRIRQAGYIQCVQNKIQPFKKIGTGKCGISF